MSKQDIEDETMTAEKEVALPDGLTMTAECVDKGDWRSKPSKWRVSLLRRLGSKHPSYTTEYTMGCAHREVQARRNVFGGVGEWVRVPQRLGGKTNHDVEVLDSSRPMQPKLADVLYALVMDASYVRHGQTLSEFGKDLGYDDLQAGITAWEGCLAAWRGLVSLGLNLDELDELFQDY